MITEKELFDFLTAATRFEQHPKLFLNLQKNIHELSDYAYR